MQCAAGLIDSHDSDSIVIEDGRDIFGREFVRGVRNQQTRLADGTVTDYNTSTQINVSIRNFYSAAD